MGIYHSYIFPRMVNWAMGTSDFQELRKDLLAPVTGIVAEIGFGTGLNLPYYTPQVSRLYAIEPSPGMKKLAWPRINQSPLQVEWIESKAEDIPLPDSSVDAVVSTWTLCSVNNPDLVLKEIVRILRRQGKFYFLEHGLSPEGLVAEWQHLLNPLQKIIAEGCHLNRPIRELIESSGFMMERLENFNMKGPRIWTYMYKGMATLN